jgi:hypothetical protein
MTGNLRRHGIKVPELDRGAQDGNRPEDSTWTQEGGDHSDRQDAH